KTTSVQCVESRQDTVSGPNRTHSMDDNDSARRTRPLYARGFSEEPGGGNRPSTARDCRTIDAGCEVVGWNPCAAADRHAGQPANAGCDGKPATNHRRR